MRHRSGDVDDHFQEKATVPADETIMHNGEDDWHDRDEQMNVMCKGRVEVKGPDLKRFGLNIHPCEHYSQHIVGDDTSCHRHCRCNGQDWHHDYEPYDGDAVERDVHNSGFDLSLAGVNIGNHHQHGPLGEIVDDNRYQNKMAEAEV